MNPDSVKKVEDIAHTVRQIGGSREQQPPQNDAMTAMTAMTTSDGAGAGGVIAGTLTALLIAGGLKGTYDFISKQYGDSYHYNF